MHHRRFVHGIPFQAVNAIAVDERRSAGRQPFFGADQAGFDALPNAAGDLQDRAGARRIMPGGAHGKGVGKEMPGDGRNRLGQNMRRSGKIDQVGHCAHAVHSVSMAMTAPTSSPCSTSAAARSASCGGSPPHATKV